MTDMCHVAHLHESGDTREARCDHLGPGAVRHRGRWRGRKGCCRGRRVRGAGGEEGWEKEKSQTVVALLLLL